MEILYNTENKTQCKEKSCLLMFFFPQSIVKRNIWLCRCRKHTASLRCMWGQCTLLSGNFLMMLGGSFMVRNSIGSSFFVWFSFWLPEVPVSQQRMQMGMYNLHIILSYAFVILLHDCPMQKLSQKWNLTWHKSNNVSIVCF